MVNFDFPLLSMEEAEEALAEIWTCAEEYHVMSPQVTFSFHGSALVSINLRIDDSAAASRMVPRMRSFVHLRQCLRAYPPVGGGSAEQKVVNRPSERTGQPRPWRLQLRPI